MFDKLGFLSGKFCDGSILKHFLGRDKKTIWCELQNTKLQDCKGDYSVYSVSRSLADDNDNGQSSTKPLSIWLSKPYRKITYIYTSEM